MNFLSTWPIIAAKDRSSLEKKVELMFNFSVRRGKFAVWQDCCWAKCPAHNSVVGGP
jgi:hypothetical protein